MAKNTTVPVTGCQVVLIDKRLEMPAYATDGSAGIDLRVCSFDGFRLQGRATIPPGATFEIGTGVKMHIGSVGSGLVGMVMPRSSLGKRGLALQNTVGVIDEDYQGEIILMCRNMHKHLLFLDPMERVAQLVLMPVFRTQLIEVAKFSVLTDRGAGGIGSTGK